MLPPMDPRLADAEFERLNERRDIDVYPWAPVAPFTSFKIGGRARWLVLPHTTAGFQAAFQTLKRTQAPYYFLGGGTNVLVGDDAFDGVVVGSAKQQSITSDPESGILTVQAGADNSDVAQAALEAKLAGAEFLYGMPGSMGGTTVMNARCYGGEISEIVTEVTAIDAQGSIVLLQQAELGFAYKTSVLQHNHYLVTEVSLQLRPGNPTEIQAKMTHNITDRRSKGQYNQPNAGCVFKNNYDLGIPTGKLIDQEGLKGWTEGQAAILPAHGNFIINRGGATAKDIVSLILRLQNELNQRGLPVECEVQFLGTFVDPLPPNYANPRPWTAQTALAS